MMQGSPHSATPALPREPRPLRLIEEAPTLADPAWLPTGTGLAALDALADEHRTILAARNGLTAHRTALLRQYEAEDEAHQAALRNSFRGGSGEAPAFTPPEERRAALASIEERSAAANDALDEFITEAVPKLEGLLPEWRAAVSERRAAAEETRREAARLVEQADAEVKQALKLDAWLVRNAGADPRPGFRSTPVRFHPWPWYRDEFDPREVRLYDENEPMATQLDVTRVPERPAWDAKRTQQRLDAERDAGRLPRRRRVKRTTTSPEED